MRFERSAGDRFERVFPETFSFRAESHDPAELYLQLDDVWSNPRRIAPAANRRDAERAIRRLVVGLPHYLEALLDRLEREQRLDAAALCRLHGDVAVLVLVVSRFVADKGLDEGDLRLACLHLRRLAYAALQKVIEARVSPASVDRYVAGAALFGAGEEISETGLFYALAGDDPEAADRWLLAMGEQAFHRWVEEVCLVEENRAFEVQGSPFGDRESEVLEAITAGDASLVRGRDLVPYLRRRNSRDCDRVLGSLESWFLRQYDVNHAAAVTQHRANVARHRDDADGVLSRHSARNYGVVLLALAAPYLAAAVAYERAPLLFDVVCSLQVGLLLASVFWFLLVRFCIRRDLTFFHASVPRIGAGIIVGYLPVFLIDEVWDLASGEWYKLLAVGTLLGFVTLLYLYVEVQRRLGDTDVAFRRALSIFMLGLVEALALGLIATSLFGDFMAARNWSEGLSPELAAGAGPVEALRETLPPFAGELPRIMGVGPLLAFPTAVFLMTFLSFFIGTFLQLMWEDIPITEPL